MYSVHGDKRVNKMQIKAFEMTNPFSILLLSKYFEIDLGEIFSVLYAKQVPDLRL